MKRGEIADAPIAVDDDGGIPKNPSTGPRLGYARALDGRVGTVVGFYKREDETVLVRFPTGESTEFAAEELELFV